MQNIVKIRKGEFFRVNAHEAPKTSQKWRVERGIAWATYSGCITDFILTPGQSLPDTQDEELLVECMSEELVITLIHCGPSEFDRVSRETQRPHPP